MSARHSLLYACARSAVLKEPRRVAFFGAAAGLNAIGQGVVAAVAGALCQSLIGGPSQSLVGSNLLSFLGPSARSPVACAVVALVAIGAKVVGGVVASYEESRIAGEVGVELRGAVLDAWLGGHLLRRARQVDHGPSGEAEKIDDLGVREEIGEGARGVAALTARVRDVEIGLARGVLGGARAVAQLIPLAFVLVALAPKLGLIAIAVLSVFSLLLGVGRAAFKREQRRLAAKHDALLEGADEAIRHADLWRTYGAEEKVRAHIGRIGGAIATHAARLEARATAWSGANEILGALALVLVLVAARAGWVGESSASSLLPFSVAFFLAYRPLRELAEARVAWMRANVASEEIDAPDASLRSVPDETSVEPSVIATSWSLAPLDLRGVILPHGSRAPLTEIIAPGSIVAVVGANGAGKTTLLRVLLGLQSATSGSIHYGDQRIDRASTGPLARPFAWVPQDAPILADTLSANVMLGGDSSSARSALLQMGLSDLAKTLGDARIGAAGRSISGGEKRLIAIARALSSELPVLLLDEPTSGLDDAAKERLLAAISKLRGSRTVILVTHASEPLEIADRVIHVGDAERRASLVA
ncbi:MAG: ABC transporter ATP-binding protein [Polyangiaceae bacterium]